ncbi:MAG: YkgJ family cysteine cluster protein [Bacteroidales bacterium]|nr:YkgJ family cysteine cluster protein [Bacteroidales bacterium]
MDCRKKCGACCIYLSISSPIPGMEKGKPSGTRCIHLAEDFSCSIYNERPDVCRNFMADPEFCGNSPSQARDIMLGLEKELRQN